MPTELQPESAPFEAFEDAALRYLPHSGSAHLVPRVLHADAESMLCIGRFPRSSPLVEDGRVPTYLAVEPAAQAAATHLALLAISRGVEIEELTGVLTGMRQTEVGRLWLPAETDLRIRVTPRGGSRGLYRYRFEVALGEAVACRGELSTFVQNELGAPTRR